MTATLTRPRTIVPPALRGLRIDHHTGATLAALEPVQALRILASEWWMARFGSAAQPRRAQALEARLASFIREHFPDTTIGVDEARAIRVTPRTPVGQVEIIPFLSAI